MKAEPVYAAFFGVAFGVVSTVLVGYATADLFTKKVTEVAGEFEAQLEPVCKCIVVSVNGQPETGVEEYHPRPKGKLEGQIM